MIYPFQKDVGLLLPVELDFIFIGTEKELALNKGLCFIKIENNSPIDTVLYKAMDY